MNPAPLQPGAVATDDISQYDRTLVTAFLENVPDFVYFKDRESRFIAASVSTARLHGFEDPAALLGKTDFDLFSEEHARPAYEDEQRVIRTGEPIHEKLERETWQDGRVTWALTSKLPLRDEAGAIIGTFGISIDITEAKLLEQALERAQHDLVDASRYNGMAEVATGVLHNVGNVLNSLNVSNNVITTGLRQSKTESLAKLVALLHEHSGDLTHYLTVDAKGRRIPEFLESLAGHFVSERARLLEEIETQQRHIDHIKDIVAMQQAYATIVPSMDRLAAQPLMQDALRMNANGLTRHSVRIVHDFPPVPDVLADKAKVLQVLVNLIVNAKNALDESDQTDKVLTLRLEFAPPDRVRFVVHDNGSGIAPDNLTRLFAHGFTTRAKGHGFGLHSSALAAKEMHGTLVVYSDGLGTGATFVLELPAAPAVTA